MEKNYLKCMFCPGLICGNDFVKYVLTKVSKYNKREFKMLICVHRYIVKTVEELERLLILMIM